jgi:hypothetical protein
MNDNLTTNASNEAENTAFLVGAVMGSYLSHSWNNEACSVCQENHKIGRVEKLCPVLYNGKCLVEQINLKIDEKRRFNYYPSLAFDTIKEYFPELKITNNYGTTKVFIHHFGRWLTFCQNYTGQYYARL